MRETTTPEPDRSYLDWMRSVAARLGNPYADRTIEGSSIALMRGRIEEAHSDAATPQISLQLLLRGQYELTADLGAGRFRCRRRAGDVIVGPPHQEIRLAGGSRQGVEMLVLAIDWKDAAALFAGDGPADALERSRRGLVRDDRLAALMVEAWRDGEEGARTLRAEELTQRILARLCSAMDAPARALPGGLAPWQFKRATEAMRERLSEDVRLAELAELVGLSPFHFTRAFRTTAGGTPHQALTAMRAARARELLATTRMSVLAIALEVGYGSGQAFARAFKRAYGVTPEECRASTAN